jgi:hypothetical protein
MRFNFPNAQSLAFEATMAKAEAAINTIVSNIARPSQSAFRRGGLAPGSTAPERALVSEAVDPRRDRALLQRLEAVRPLDLDLDERHRTIGAVHHVVLLLVPEIDVKAQHLAGGSPGQSAAGKIELRSKADLAPSASWTDEYLSITLTPKGAPERALARSCNQISGYRAQARPSCRSQIGRARRSRQSDWPHRRSPR